MQALLERFAEALKHIDSSGVRCKRYKPGVGPYGETQLVKMILDYLKRAHPTEFQVARTKRMPDILIPNQWALEVKIVRPFGDNGNLAEHWSENLLHPYEGNVSAIGDCFKLLKSGLSERKGIIVFTYEHTPPKVDLDILISIFEILAKKILKIQLGPRHVVEINNLIHPEHQQSKIYGWELLNS